MCWLNRCEIMADADGQGRWDRWQIDYEFFEATRMVHLFHDGQEVCYGPLSTIQALRRTLMGR